MCKRSHQLEITSSPLLVQMVYKLTKVLDLQNALVLEPNSRHCRALFIGNHATVARFGDPQTVD